VFDNIVLKEENLAGFLRSECIAKIDEQEITYSIYGMVDWIAM
jgi:hypothetical protein